MMVGQCGYCKYYIVKMINNDQRHSICEIIIILAIIAIVVYIIVHNGGGGCKVDENFDKISSIEAGTVSCDTFTVSNIASIIDVIYPVGSIYISINTANPKDLFGVGIWQHLPADKYLRTLTDGNTAESGLCGGGDIIEENMLPKHRHGILSFYDDCNYNPCDLNDGYGMKSIFPDGDKTKTPYDIMSIPNDLSKSIKNNGGAPRRTTYTEYTGEGKGFYPSFIRIHAWKRTA